MINGTSKNEYVGSKKIKLKLYSFYKNNKNEKHKNVFCLLEIYFFFFNSYIMLLNITYVAFLYRILNKNVSEKV